MAASDEERSRPYLSRSTARRTTTTPAANPLRRDDQEANENVADSVVRIVVRPSRHGESPAETWLHECGIVPSASGGAGWKPAPQRRNGPPQADHDHTRRDFALTEHDADSGETVYLRNDLIGIPARRDCDDDDPPTPRRTW